jgi:hypothetical protein
VPTVTRHHFGWLQRAIGLADIGFEKYDEKALRDKETEVVEFIQNYWSGKPWKFDPNIDWHGAVWEYLAPVVKVVKKKDG